MEAKEWNDRHAELRASMVAAVRAFREFEGCAGFSIPLDAEETMFVSVGSEQTIRDLSGGMTELRAREILADRLGSDGELYARNVRGILLNDNMVTADRLEAIAWWMRNKEVTT